MGQLRARTYELPCRGGIGYWRLLSSRWYFQRYSDASTKSATSAVGGALHPAQDCPHQHAYNLGHITVKLFRRNKGLPSSRSKTTARPSTTSGRGMAAATDSYAQLQEIRTYDKFHDVDVDRYDSTARTAGHAIGAKLSGRFFRPRPDLGHLRPPSMHGMEWSCPAVTRKSTEGRPTSSLEGHPPVASGGRCPRAAHRSQPGRRTPT